MKRISREVENSSRIVAGILLTVLSASSIPAWAGNDGDDGLQWSFSPYIWGMDTEADVSINDLSVNEELKFSDVIDKVELAFQGHLEANTDRFGFFTDVTYFSVADDGSHGSVQVDAGITLSIYEVAAIYKIHGTPLEGFSIFGGARHLSVEQDFSLRGEGERRLQHSSSSSTNLTDGMLGARYQVRISERWQLGLRGDYAAGDTDGVWNLVALFGRDFKTKRVSGSALVGYRYMQMDLDAGATESEYTLSGPIIGLRIAF